MPNQQTAVEHGPYTIYPAAGGYKVVYMQRRRLFGKNTKTQQHLTTRKTYSAAVDFVTAHKEAQKLLKRTY